MVGEGGTRYRASPTVPQAENRGWRRVLLRSEVVWRGASVEEGGGSQGKSSHRGKQAFNAQAAYISSLPRGLLKLG
ncbi:hypothetical protein C8Q70DRAFT_952298 [Cubamyces menziesii]|nr:hypothetical protein C8Q70DRAFT_952298 [Cubamyces menziesii]